MSTPMYDVPVHFLMPINDYGGGPEMDPKKVVRIICWSCMPEEDWPCEAYRLENRWLEDHEFRELGESGFCFTCGDFPGEGNHREAPQ